MKITITLLDELGDTVEKALKDLLPKYDTARTHEVYERLVTTIDVVKENFVNSIEWDTSALASYLSKDHPFRSLSLGCYNLGLTNLGNISVRPYINGGYYDFTYDPINMSFKFPDTRRKNNEEIQRYFKDKFIHIDFVIIEGGK